jgi:hemerythrin-like domain-containing protein
VRDVRPTDLLMTEHRLIERMIALLSAQIHDLSARDRPAGRRSGLPATISGADAGVALIEFGVDFFGTYADRTHHGKEESILFARLSEKTLADAEEKTMRRLAQEHASTRQTVNRLAAANARYGRGDEGALQTLLYETDRLVQLYPAHIELEELHFFGPAMDYFSNAEQQAMLARFVEFDSRIIHDRYSRILEELEQHPHIPVASFMA